MPCDAMPPWFRTARLNAGVALAMGLMLGACATAPPKTPQQYRAKVVEVEGPPTSTPVALMATYQGHGDDPFIVHHFSEQGGRLFTDRIVVFDPKDAGSRVLVVMDEANLAHNGGLFNTKRVISIKGYVKHANHEPIRVETSLDMEEKVPVVGYASLAAGWCFTLLSVISGIFGVPYVPLISYVLGEQLRGNYRQVKDNAEQAAIDNVSSGAVTAFLNAAWAKIDTPSMSEVDKASNDATRLVQQRAEEEARAVEKLAQVREESDRLALEAKAAEDVAAAAKAAEQKLVDEKAEAAGKAARQAAAEEAVEEKAADARDAQEKVDRKKARAEKAAKKAGAAGKK